MRCTCGEIFTVDVQPLRRLIEEGKQILSDDDNGQLGKCSDSTTDSRRRDCAA